MATRALGSLDLKYPKAGEQKLKEFGAAKRSLPAGE